MAERCCLALWGLFFGNLRALALGAGHIPCEESSLLILFFLKRINGEAGAAFLGMHSPGRQLGNSREFQLTAHLHQGGLGQTNSRFRTKNPCVIFDLQLFIAGYLPRVQRKYTLKNKTQPNFCKEVLTWSIWTALAQDAVDAFAGR